MNNYPKYPIFIPTKKRWKYPYTIKALKEMNVKFKIVIEEQEYEYYSQLVDNDDILVLPYLNKGLRSTRNWIWDYAEKKKYKRYWTFDDNIVGFMRMNQNIKWRIKTSAFLRAIEEFVDRYRNVAIAGMEYDYFYPRKIRYPPFALNHRVYSNMLIKTNIPYRNKLSFNDDTDLCIQVLKDGWCTILFNIFLVKKISTMKTKGGLTDYYNKTNERYEFAKELRDAHPNIVKIVRRYGRWHHQVDYSKFKKNILIKKNTLIDKKVNNYGMIFNTLVETEKGGKK